MNKQNQNGSSHIVIIVAVAILLISGIGFLFWNNFIQNKESTDVKQASDNLEKKKAVSPSTSTKPYDFETAIADINTVLSDNVCGGAGIKEALARDSFDVVKNTDVFVYRGGKNYINEDYTHAFVQYGCGSQGSGAWLERKDGAWSLITNDARIYPMCENVKGHNFPKSILDKCYVNDSDAEPTAI